MIVARWNAKTGKTAIYQRDIPASKWRFKVWTRDATGYEHTEVLTNKTPCNLGDMIELAVDSIEQCQQDAIDAGGMIDGGWIVEQLRGGSKKQRKKKTRRAA